MKTILVPTDFSANAEHAIRYAVIFAKPFGAKVVLFHSYLLPVYATDLPLPVATDEALRLASQESLEKLATRMRSEFPGVNFETRLEAGYAEEAIRAAVEAMKADMVIMGTRGASGIREALIGTITASMLEVLDVPLIAVPAESPVKAPSRIVFATNYSEGDFQHVLDVIEIAKGVKARVSLLHVSSGELEKEYEYEAIERFKERLKEDSHFANIDFNLLENKDVYEGLSEFLISSGADFVATSMRRRSFLQKLFTRSITKEMAYHTHIPLLAFKVGDKR